MAAIVAFLALAVGGGNGGGGVTAASADGVFAIGGEQVRILPAYPYEHDPDLRPADVVMVVIEATPTASPVAIAPAVAAGQAGTFEPVTSLPLANLEGCPAVIVETFGANAPAACAVAWCESRYSAWAVGDHGASVGLFQIQPRWHQWRVPGEDLADPAVNTRAAWLISSGGTDWSAWTCRP